MKCICGKDWENCPVHDWRSVVDVPDRREELREREIRRGMRMTSTKKNKQEF